MMFTSLFGGAPHARVLDYLAREPHVDHTITGIARGTDVSRPTVYKVIDDLLEEDVVIQTRTVGNSRFFQLNLEDPLIQDLLSLVETHGETEIELPPFELAGPEQERSRPRTSRRQRNA